MKATLLSVIVLSIFISAPVSAAPANDSDCYAHDGGESECVARGADIPDDFRPIKDGDTRIRTNYGRDGSYSTQKSVAVCDERGCRWQSEDRFGRGGDYALPPGYPYGYRPSRLYYGPPVMFCLVGDIVCAADAETVRIRIYGNPRRHYGRRH